MKKIYTLGHGFSYTNSQEPNSGCSIPIDQDHAIMLKGPMKTYIGEGNMLDAFVIAPLINNDRNDKNYPTPINSYVSGDKVREHLLCSDASSLMDVQHVNAWKVIKEKQAISTCRTILEDDHGSLYKLNDEAYLYLTYYGVLTGLSVIQDTLIRHFGNANFELHWTACRSYATGRNPEEVIASCTSDLARPNKILVKNLVPAISITQDS